MKISQCRTLTGIVILTAIGSGLSGAFARPGGGFRGAAAHPGGAPHGAYGGIPHGVPHAAPHVAPGFHPPAVHPAGHANFAYHGGPAFHNPALYHAPGAHWNGYHQVAFGGRPMHLGWAGYRPSFYYHPWYHGPWSGHAYGWGWGFGPGVSFGIGGGGWGIGVGTGWGYAGYASPYGPYGYWGRPMGWGFGGWGLGTVVYSSGYYPYYNPYYSPYAGGPLVYNYVHPIPVAAQAPHGNQAAQPASEPPANPAFDRAREEFRRGHYSAALSHIDAIVRAEPTDAVAHEFRALILFSLREYRQSAAVMHSILAVGPGWDWTTLSGLYADPAIYEQQLHALEEFTREHPRAPEGHFLLGYHYMIGSHADAAFHEFQIVEKLVPADRLAGELLLMVKGPPKTSDDPAAAPPSAAVDPGAVPEIPPVNKDFLVGNWHAAREDGSQFRLNLAPDGTFHWKFSAPNQAGADFRGTYSVDGPVLALEHKEGGVMAGTARFVDDRHFNFRMVGGPPSDSGLDFRK